MSIFSAIVVTAVVLLAALLSDQAPAQRSVGAELPAMHALHAGSFR